MHGATVCCVLLAAAAVAVTADRGDHIEHHGHGDHVEHHGGHSGHKNGLHVSTLPASVTAHAVDHHDDDHHEDHHADHPDREHAEAFSAIDHRLDRLTSRMGHLQESVHRRTNPATIRKARSFRARVQKLTGSGCDDKHFQCGGNDPECQSYLFVCDGHKDCRNGADEEHCELPTKKGDYFEGHIITDTCTQRRPEEIGFEITSVTTSNYFTPVARLTGNVVMDFDNPFVEGHASLPSVGAYHFGRKVVVFKPPESDQLMLFCKFDGYNMDKCDGFIAHEASGNICAEIAFVRKGHHDDHDEYHAHDH